MKRAICLRCNYTIVRGLRRRGFLLLYDDDLKKRGYESVEGSQQSREMEREGGCFAYKNRRCV